MSTRRRRDREQRQPLEELAVKVVRGVRPGDVVFIETSHLRTEEQLKHLSLQFKKLLPEVKVVILNAGMRVADVQANSDG